MSPTKTFLTLLGGVILVASFLAYQLLKNPYLDRDRSGPVTISSEWSEITPNSPLKPEREIHEVVLDFAEPVTPIYETWSIRLADGSIVKPEARLVDEKGNEFKLESPSLSSEGTGLSMRDASHAEGLPKDRKYRAVLLRSGTPLKLSRVYWRCYNPWDRK